MSETKKRFSIIIPVYNAEKFLTFAIDSVVGQSLDFTENVELVLVNDGSMDSSGEICLQYQEKYPENVIYERQENAGPSAARNRGLELATGEIIGFLDADDKLSTKTLKSVDRYFDLVLEATDVAIVPVKNFGASAQAYYLDKKFDQGTRTLQLDKKPEWNSPCMRVGQAFFVAEAAKRHKFDNSITFFEDTKYINEVISEKMRVGLVTGCNYFYRRYPADAASDTSLTVGAENNTRLYLETPVKVILPFFKKYKNDQDAPLYFQYLALCEMRWRMFYTSNRTSEFLSIDEFREYEKINKQILHYVSDKAIMTFEKYTDWQKIYLFNLKYGIDVMQEATVDSNNRLVWKDYVLADMNSATTMLLDMQVSNDCFVLKYFYNVLMNTEVVPYALVNGIRASQTRSEIPISPTKFPLDYDYYSYQAYLVKVPLNGERKKVTFGLRVSDIDLPVTHIAPSMAYGIVKNVRPEKQVKDGYVLTRVDDGIEIAKQTVTNAAVTKAKKAIASPNPTVQGKMLQYMKKAAKKILRRK